MNKRNLQKELEIIINESEALGVRPKLLLHACCAPCSSHCMEYLNKYFDITIYFYNPNIDNFKEYNLRVEEEKRLIDELDLPYKVGFMEGEYEPKRFHELVKGIKLWPQDSKNIFVAKEKKATWETNKELIDFIKAKEKEIAGKGRILVRASGTESLIRVMVEAESQETVDKYIEELSKKVEEILC